MYCIKCQNFMDISNNLSFINDNENNIESSDYETSLDKNDLLTKKDITDILNGKDKNIYDKINNVNDIKNNMYFEELDDKDKNIIINKYFEFINKNNSDNVKNTYFYCSNCGYSEIIKNNTVIFSKNTKVKDNELLNENFLNYKYDQTLPTTKKYNCLDDKCPTHKDPAIKNAIFYRIEKTYEIKYICTICNSYWKTSL